MLDGELEAIDRLLAGDDRLIQIQQLRNQQAILTQLENIVASLDALRDAVAAERTVVDGAVVLLAGLSERIAALELTQEAVDALAAEVKDQAADLSAAVAAVPSA